MASIALMDEATVGSGEVVRKIQIDREFIRKLV